MKYLFILLQIPLFIRLLLEFSSANVFIEPINSIRKVTNPVILPLKKMMPLPWMQRFVAEIIAFLISLVGGVVVYGHLVIGGLLLHVEAWMIFLQYGIILYVIGSWVQIPALQKSNYLLHHIFEPLLAPIRKVVPSLGGVIDVSPMIFWFGISMLSSLFYRAVA